MKYAIIQNNTITQIGALSNLFPNTSFPANGPSTEWLQALNVLKVVETLSFDNNVQRLVDSEPYIRDNKVYTVSLVNLTTDEINLYNINKITAQWANIRTDRNSRLQDCDWTQASDSPVDKQAWATYRQQLRDVPTQPDPFNITWPTKP